MRVLRRDHAVLAVPRPAAQLDRGPRRRTRAPRPRRAPADGRAAVRSPGRRALPVPRGAPRPHARAGGREAPGRALTGGAPVPDVRGRSRAHRPACRGGPAGRRAGGSPLGGCHVAPAAPATLRRHGGHRAPAGADIAPGARSPVVASEGGRGPPAPAPGHRPDAGSVVGRRRHASCSMRSSARARSPTTWSAASSSPPRAIRSSWRN